MGFAIICSAVIIALAMPSGFRCSSAINNLASAVREVAKAIRETKGGPR
jgi:hypothetical protein